ncbi:MAG: CPBP family intramembrane glutamic endopeptidase, partial [Isosphaeraceae bacterium]
PGPARAADEPTSYRPPVAGATAVAITLVSLVFGALHASQWPAPIPIFVLALGLGLVSYRTGSLLSPICMHAIFNGISTIGILLSLHTPLEKSVRPVEPATERVTPDPGGKGQAGPPHVDLRPQGAKREIPGTSSWTPMASTVRVWVSCKTIDGIAVSACRTARRAYSSLERARVFEPLAVNAGPGNDR